LGGALASLWKLRPDAKYGLYKIDHYSGTSVLGLLSGADLT